MVTPRLLESLPLRERIARNRLWLPPMCTYSAAEDGVVTPWHVVHYGARAAGGFGTVVVEATAVSPRGRLSPRDLGLWEDAQVAGHSRLVEAIHASGSLAGVQLGHGGRKAGTPPWRPDTVGARQGTLAGWDLVAPSALAYPGHATPRELDLTEVRALVEAFAQAASRAVAAGYDLVELHGAHGYLLHEFLSPLSNHRTDTYGETTAGRRRLVLEVVGAVREAVGDAVLGIRLSATDWTAGGLTGEQTAELAPLLVEAGADVLHVSTGGNVPAKVPVAPGYQVPFAARVRDAVAATATPVVTVGVIRSATQAEQILVTGQADAVAVGRPALLDPSLPLRWARDLGTEGWQAQGVPVPYWRGVWAS